MCMKKLLLIFFIAGFICPAQSQTAAELAEMSSRKAAAKDYRGALTLINKAISLNDTNQWYYMDKADIEFSLYGLRPALMVLSQAKAINRKNPELYNRMAGYYMGVNMNDSAVSMYNVAIKMADTDTLKKNYLLNRGAAKENMRDFKGAVEDYEQVLAFNPNDLAALNNAAAAYDDLGRTDKSIAYLKKVIVIDPTFIGPYVNLGFIYSGMDSLDLAIRYFDKALSYEPGEALSYNNRGYVYYKKGDYKNALKDINHSLELLKGNSYAYRNLALVYLATQKSSEACDALETAKRFGFAENYGPEVDELIQKHCRKK